MAQVKARAGTGAVASVALAAVAALAAACFDQQYRCTSNANCVRGGVGGFCQPTGNGLYCMFPDSSCPNKVRWDATASSDVAGKCVDPSCKDGIKNGVPVIEDGAETDVDCGGAMCGGCPGGKACNHGSDCISKRCIDKTCAPPECADKVRNGDETDVDCGGPTCGRCPDTFACLTSNDCLHGDCFQRVCKTPQCDDERANGSETDLDCGGPVCAFCMPAARCVAASDCSTGVCSSNRCVPVRFQVAKEFAGGTKPSSIVAIDYDRDGDLDLLLNNERVETYRDYPASVIARLDGNGTGGFVAQSTSISVQANSRVMLSADFNADGYPDLVLANWPEPNRGHLWWVSALINNHDRNFSLKQPVLTEGSRGAAIADFDGDLLLDVAFTVDNGSVGLIFSNGSGDFRTNYVEFAELPSKIVFRTHLPADYRLVAADFNGDGHPDLAYNDSKGGIALLINTGPNKTDAGVDDILFTLRPGIIAGSGLVGSMGTGDFNHDGRADLVCIGSEGEVITLLGFGDGTFHEQHVARGTSALEIVVADVNEDGHLDVVSGTRAHAVQVLYGNGRGNLVRGADLALPSTVSATANATHIATGHFNGDKKLDVAATTGTTNFVYVWLQQ